MAPPPHTHHYPDDKVPDTCGSCTGGACYTLAHTAGNDHHNTDQSDAAIIIHPKATSMHTHAPSSCKDVSHSPSVSHTWSHRAGPESRAQLAPSSHTDTLSSPLEDMSHSRHGDRDECNDAFRKTTVCHTYPHTRAHPSHRGACALSKEYKRLQLGVVKAINDSLVLPQGQDLGSDRGHTPQSPW